MTTPKRSSIACHVFVKGRVQGVAFRWSTQQLATRLGLQGWIRNCRDGRVEVWVEGAPEAVGVMRDWLRHGPLGAHVTEMELFSAICQGIEGFSINADY